MSMALAMVARARAMRRSPIPSVPALSNLYQRETLRKHYLTLHELFANLRSCSERTALCSSPGFATFRKRQRTKNAEMTSTPDWIPKKMSDLEPDSAPKPMDKPPSRPL